MRYKSRWGYAKGLCLRQMRFMSRFVIEFFQNSIEYIFNTSNDFWTYASETRERVWNIHQPNYSKNIFHKKITSALFFDVTLAYSFPSFNLHYELSSKWANFNLQKYKFFCVNKIYEKLSQLASFFVNLTEW